MSDNKSYKDTLKATSLFGGVQVYNIIIGIVRSKFTALLLGTSGMGISGLYFSATNLINAFSSLGISSSAVKNIAEANSLEDQEQLVKVVSIFRKLTWFTGFLGVVLCFVFAPWLSQLSFGNKDYTVAFMLLSCTLLFQQLTLGQNTLMQGLHKYTYMAKANVIGSTIGLFITIPLYYLWGIKSIIPVIIIASITSLVLSYIFSNKLGIKSVPVSNTEVWAGGKNMVVMGIMISLSSILSLAASYIVRIFISNIGGIHDVGLYNAGFAIVNTYVGMIFTAMGTDYYPRLAAASKDNDTFNRLINNQIEIALFLLSPIIVVFIIFIRPIVVLLYSNQFIPIEGMVYWAIFAIFFKATSWAIAFLFLAKSDAKVFFFNELAAVVYTTLLNIVCYRYLGLNGLGISFLISYVIYLLQVWSICHRRYHLELRRYVWRIYLIQLPLSTICLLLVKNTSPAMHYSIGSILFMVSLYISYCGLDKKVGIKEFVINKLHKNRM